MTKRYLKAKYWLPRAVALSVAVAVYFVLTHFSVLQSGVRTFFGYFSPVLLGCVIAYLVSPLAKLYRRTLFRAVKGNKGGRILSNVLAYITLLSFLSLLLVILIPQLIDGVSLFSENLDSYLEAVRSTFSGFRAFGNVLNMENILASREKLLETVADAIRNNADRILKTSALAGKSLFQWLIGLFLSAYLLAEKDSLKSGGKRLMRALLPGKRYSGLLTFLRRSELILNRYVVFNLLDSLIIGAANAVFMAAFGIPYVGLVSFIVAVTNLVPTFGPIIGGAVGALLLCLVRMRYAAAFLIFTVIIQLCDAYIVKPKLFGNSLGVSSLWILVGIIVGGRMFGVVGVLLAIPVVAILDFLYEDYLLPKLEAARSTKEAETQMEVLSNADGVSLDT